MSLRRRRYIVDPKRLAELERRTNPDGTLEDPAAWVARQIHMWTPFEITAHYLMRDDDVQRRAMELALQARTERWTRIAVVGGIATSLFASLVAIVIAVAT